MVKIRFARPDPDYVQVFGKHARARQNTSNLAILAQAARLEHPELTPDPVAAQIAKREAVLAKLDARDAKAAAKRAKKAKR